MRRILEICMIFGPAVPKFDFWPFWTLHRALVAAPPGSSLLYFQGFSVDPLASFESPVSRRCCCVNLLGLRVESRAVWEFWPI